MKIFTSIVFASTLILSGWATETTAGTDSIYNIACGDDVKKSQSPWHISNLYDCRKKTMFIPYQLWTGMDWNGDKTGDCMHKADSYFVVNRTSATTITGPHDWKGKKVWHRNKVSGSKQQYFVCHKKGIGRVYDSRNSGRFYSRGRCKFPAGYGWSIGKRRYCKSTSIKIVEVELDDDDNLFAIKFKWWTQNHHDHTYRYEVGTGSTNAWKQ